MDTLYDTWQNEHFGDFAAGVRLLVTHNPRAVTSRILMRLQTLATTGAEPEDYLIGKLTHALRDSPGIQTFELLDHEPASPRGPISPIPPISQVEGKLRVPEAIPLHKQHSHFHALLVAASTDAERADHARVIMEEILPQLDSLYDAARNPDEQPAPAKPKNDGVQTIRKLQALRTRVSLLKNKLIPNAPSVARKAELEKELQLKMAEIETIQNEIA